MRLKSIEVSEFQSIRYSNRFDVDDITCLVGKNEAGKTALLQAIYRLNPIIENDGHFDVTDDFPRSDVEDYQYDVENGKRKPAIVIKAIFELDKKEIQPIESNFGNGILKSTDLTLSKGYENKIFIDLEINERIVISSILKRAQLPSDLNKHFLKFTDFDSFTDEIEQYNNSDNNEHINRLNEQIKNITDDNGLIVHFYSKYLESFVPKFLYFDEYFLMRGCENIEQLKARIENNQLKKSDHPLLGLIDLARLNIDDLLTPDRTQWLINKLQGASNHLNKKILDYWSQNKHLEIEFDVRLGRPGDPEDLRSGNNLWAHVRDTKHKVKTMLGTRSRGFVWFFSFLAWYYQQQKKQEPLILLLDEPGLFLHGKAQGDLLKYMESELKGNHQVIYTTHSPFMVDPQKFERVRIVQDKGMDTLKTLPAEEEGTKVLTDILDATDDSLFPLQGALGYEIHQTLFIGPNNLVVEGVSDLLYLQTITGILNSLNREGLSKKWTITPVGGAEKVPTFVSLLGSQKGMKVATLIDIQKKHKQMIENLYKKKLLKQKNVLTFADFTSKSESDIEDMFEIDFYLELVNSEYSSLLETPISESMLKLKSPRIIIRIEDYLKKHPLKESAQFSHFRPARYFVENVSSLQDKISEKTLGRFESAFKALNKLL